MDVIGSHIKEDQSAYAKLKAIKSLSRFRTTFCCLTIVLVLLPTRCCHVFICTCVYAMDCRSHYNLAASSTIPMEIRRELLKGFNGRISERQSKKYGEMRK